ncbi:terpenoid cyclases/protein prenyltransferase alpha-alpha toroid [Gymnopilus junonius]|uniref:Terpenoid cyclases/protein prenyltransferase alpha-alpha toroid n=1 Tax=Gymnopilus junonius TaxID=109634 RepID=A0A9P5NNB3_GYMJU|nr:terpenoid cyclases/protein prenyltransferase alpha-alpha toroid [Gymnopilus junonius]
MTDISSQLPRLSRAAHAAHCKRCLSGLPASQTDVDASRLALGFYCIGSLDLLGLLESQVPSGEREDWRAWLWKQQARGKYGSGFRPSPLMTAQRLSHEESMEYTDYDTPHIIMTYTALLSLGILRDDFSKLDRPGLLKFLRSCQRADGSFSTVPGSNESDLRTLYCAFAISNMLNDWSGVDIPSAISFVATCRTHEGGYGQSTHCEAQGGTTYIAVASLSLASTWTGQAEYLTNTERDTTIRWLVQNHDKSGGFCGRTGKNADACYCFWCGAALKILGAGDLVDADALASFLARCQFKYGGIAKAPGESSDPYHTYLSLAALSMYPPRPEVAGAQAPSWRFEPLDPLLNAREDTALWVRIHVPEKAV